MIMAENEYKFGDKVYTREELLAFGKSHYPKFYWIFRGVGLGLLATALFTALFAIPFLVAGEPYFWVYFIIAAPFFVPGVVLFIISFKEKPDEDYIKHAVDYYTKLEARKAQRKDRVTYKKENRNINQLLKYKELYDAGVITKEELDAKKKEFLDKE